MATFPRSRWAKLGRRPSSRLQQLTETKKRSRRESAGVSKQSLRPVKRSSLWGKRSLKQAEVVRSRPVLPTVPVQVTRFRLILVWGILLLCGLALALNLYRLQVVESAMLQERAQQQQTIALQPFTPRRSIIDRMGNVLAIDRPAYTLYAHPKLFKHARQTVASEISAILNRSADDVAKQLGTEDSGIRLEDALSEEQADQITTLRIDGLELIQHPQRLYPQQDLFANVVGYINVDRQGEAGLELGQRELLERSSQPVQLNRWGDGSLVPDQVPEGFLHQDDLRLQLTLDSRLQRAAGAALAKQVKQFGAKRGAVLVMDDRDGSLLSMVTTPTYDPNQYFKFSLERFRNWTVSDPYEPGSTFKPINVAIALQTGAIRPTDSVYDEGQIIVDGWPVQNNDYAGGGGRGTITLTEVLKYSSNVGMVHVMQKLKPSLFYEWLGRIGLGKTVGVDLPDENPGQIKSREQFTEASIEPATTAFGQGFTLTPIQLLQLHGMLANNGRLVTPHLITGMYSASGKPMWQPDRPATKQVVSPQVAQTVMHMMEAVVQDGTGKVAQIPGYRIAGKTGTAQKASGGGYSNARITSFVSSFPVEAPRYTVLVVVDEPQGDNAFGSTVAAPVAKSVMEALIAIEHIPPSEPVRPQPASQP